MKWLNRSPLVVVVAICSVTFALGSIDAQPTPTPTVLANISTRLRVGTNQDVGIAGFILINATYGLVIRGLGPSLQQQGIVDFLSDPVLELRDSSGNVVFQNDNWWDDPSGQSNILSALGLAPTNSLESAICVLSYVIPSGAYTAVLSGKNAGIGVGLVEVYAVSGNATDVLKNVSTRGFIQSGEDVMIGGFILTGSYDIPVAVRGIGPSLASSGVSDPLSDTTLELRDINGALLDANDNWQDDPASADELISYGLQPTDPNEAAILAFLSPGTYTAIVAGKNGETGVGLVEIYDLL